MLPTLKTKYSHIRYAALDWDFDLLETKKIIKNIHNQKDVFSIGNNLFVHNDEINYIEISKNYEYINEFYDYHILYKRH